MPKSTILWLDDQLVTHERIRVKRYSDFFDNLKSKVELIEATGIDEMFDILMDKKTNDQEIHGFLIDQLLTHNQTSQSFSRWGVPSLKLIHEIGGVQIVMLFRHNKYRDERDDSNHPLSGIAQYYKDTKVALLTAYLDGTDVLKGQGLSEDCCDCFLKDEDHIEEELIEWINKRNPCHNNSL
jgi:hypothetical protein